MWVTYADVSAMPIETGQSRTLSLVEAVVNVVVGFAVAFVAQLALFSVLAIDVSLANNLLVAGVFTVLSIVRSFTLRRAFEALRLRQIERWR